jgi:uncharacterized protein YxjI
MKNLILTLGFLGFVAGRAEAAEHPGQGSSSNGWGTVTHQTAARDGGLTLPNEFQIHQKVVSWIPAYTLRTSPNQPDFGEIDEQILSWGKTFEIKDKNGKIVGRAKERIFSWGTTIDVTDENGNKLGTIREDLLKSFLGLGVTTQYKITDANDRLIAKSDKLDWIGTLFTLTDNSGNVLVQMKRPWVNFLSDDWSVKIQQPNKLDPRLYLAIAAYKSESDAERRHKSSHDSDESHDD